MLDSMAQEVQPGDQVLDIGAWVGPYTLLASQLTGAGGRVYAFEPDPVARDLLEQNLAANGLANVSVFPWAIAEQRGSALLVASKLGGSVTRAVPTSESQGVSTLPLDEFCQERDVTPSIIKIDVEGGEAGVLAGGNRSLRRARCVYLEFHCDKLREQGIDPAQLWRQLFTLGKDVFLLGTGGDATPPGTQLQPDVMISGDTQLLLK